MPNACISQFAQRGREQISQQRADDLDKELKRRGHRFVRYADDFIVMVKSLSAGTRVMASIRRFLEQKLHLKMNEKKSKVVPVGECGFLGFVFIRGKIRWTDKSFQEFKRRIRRFTGRCRLVWNTAGSVITWATLN